MIELLFATLVGTAAGLLSATWGMFKDAPHEGFAWSSYARSPLVGAVVALSVAVLTPLDAADPAGVVVLFGVVYGLERALVEVYTTFFREGDGTEYTIPMQFSVGGEAVESRVLRVGAGVVYLAAVLAILYGTWLLERAVPELDTVVVALAVGSLGGWISALGGAWKDAPVEGFHLLKFFRSPLLASLYGLMVASLTTSYPAVFVGSLGYTVASIETWKTFRRPGEPPGKFSDQPVRHPEMVRRRYWLVPLYALIWLGVLAAIALALLGVGTGQRL